MNLAELTALGGVIPSAPQREEITWVRDTEEGEKEDSFFIHVVQLAYGDVHTISAENSTGKDQRRVYTAQLICAAVRLGDDASERLTYEQAYHLHPGLGAAMLSAVVRVNPSLRVKKKAEASGGDMARTGAARNRRANSRRSKAKSHSE
ncbi:MAG: phage tail assembly chaperone family protein, TAC [Gammaproteobacteria bacterium]|nr:phage tail assembly chaperone family protein, TAC [Gammaproteobacteria bacterium]